ncbi:hypothetical protein LCGC14_0849980 [marine sediment metagenome]|uniref:Uncharacterized protein n=1 Tax=marine sediment metagenome TaxID=412755 RepID=A0A0F9SHN7_9ZZZZ
MVIKVHHVKADPLWLGHEERDARFGWTCPECKVQYYWSQSWSYAGPIEDGGYICLDCAHRLGLLW